MTDILNRENEALRLDVKNLTAQLEKARREADGAHEMYETWAWRYDATVRNLSTDLHLERQRRSDAERTLAEVQGVVLALEGRVRRHRLASAFLALLFFALSVAAALLAEADVLPIWALTVPALAALAVGWAGGWTQ